MSCFVFTSSFRLEERKGLKYTFRGLFYFSLSICMSRFQLQYISLKAISSKLVFSYTVSQQSVPTLAALVLTKLSSFISGSFYRGVCSYIIHSFIHITFYSQKTDKIDFFMAVDRIFFISFRWVYHLKGIFNFLRYTLHLLAYFQ